MEIKHSSIEIIASPTKITITGVNFKADKLKVYVLPPERYSDFLETQNDLTPLINPTHHVEGSKSNPTYTLELTEIGKYGFQWDGNELGNLVPDYVT